MLLTISQPTKPDFGSRYTHEFSPRIPLLKSRVSPQPPRVDSPVSSLQASVHTADIKMSTPHRGLPPPAAMTLPDPRDRPPPSSLAQSLHQPLGAMPQPPNQWQGQEEAMRSWLMAKAEEDKRKQEEQKTRQEECRLEQRRIEQAMLRDSLQAGVPPSMVPMIYAGIGGANLANISIDWLQQYASQLQLTQQQIQQQSPPELRRDSRLIHPAPAEYGQPAQQQVLPNQNVAQTQPAVPLQTTFSAYQPPTSGRTAPISGPRSATHTQLPRLTTNEMFTHQPPPPANPGSAHPLQQSQTIQQQEPPTSSPSIYFHHWVPPNESKVQPQTPASKGEPHSAHPGSHLSESDYRDSPRKRKAQGGHERNPPPQHTSPSFSTGSSASARKAGHARSRSNASARESDSRPGSRREPQSGEERREGSSGRPSLESRPGDER